MLCKEILWISAPLGLDSPLWIGMQVAQYANLLLIPRWLTVRIIRDLLLLLLLLLLWWGCVGSAQFIYLSLSLFALCFLPSLFPSLLSRVVSQPLLFTLLQVVFGIRLGSM